ncbi:MAG: alanine racemase [Steroidobacteraceae bacterium]
MQTLILLIYRERGLRQEHDQEGHGGDRPCQAPQRRDRHVRPELPGPVLALRELCPDSSPRACCAEPDTAARRYRCQHDPHHRARVGAAALRHNLRRVRAAAPARVVAVVKANAYGHGLVPTALALPDADAFAVARLEEGLQLRSAGILQPIVLLEGVFSAEQLAESRAPRFDSSCTIRCSSRSRVTPPFHALAEDRYRHEPARLPAGGVRCRCRPAMLAVPALEVRLLTHLARADEPTAG